MKSWWEDYKSAFSFWLFSTMLLKNYIISRKYLTTKYILHTSTYSINFFDTRVLWINVIIWQVWEKKVQPSCFVHSSEKKAPSVYMIDILMCGIWWQQSAEAVVSGLQIIQSSNQAMHQSKLTYVQVTFQSITFIKRPVWWRLWWL